MLSSSDPKPALVRFTLSPPAGTTTGGFDTWGKTPAVSPDGARILFPVMKDRTIWLAVRALADRDAELLAQSDRGQGEAWSADSQSLLYRGSEGLMRLDLTGGSTRLQGEGLGGVAWSPNGAILTGGLSGPVTRVDGGGDFSTTLDEGENSHLRPYFLPDGEQFLFYSPSTKGIYLSALNATSKSFLRSADSSAIYVEPGYLVFNEGGTLMAQSFSPSKGKLDGTPVPIVQDVATGLNGRAAFSASEGVLAYVAGDYYHSQLKRFDREGDLLEVIAEPAPYRTVTLSPDGRRAVVMRDRDLWVLDLDRGGIGAPVASGGDPVWSPDGKELVLSERGSGSISLYRLSLAAGSEPELILSWDKNVWADQWHASDNQVTFHDGYSIQLLPMDGGYEPRELLRQQERLDEPYRSPDGKWLAFISSETGRWEVYVENLETKERARVSSEGGGAPRWRGDGRELFYLALDGMLMAASFDPELGVRGVAEPLFESPVGAVLPVSDQWDVHPDGDRFLFVAPTNAERPIHVILNWQNLLEED
jgi:hypothetical protein